MQSITIRLIPHKPQPPIKPISRHPPRMRSQLQMMHAKPLSRLNNTPHQRLPVSKPAAPRTNNHRFHIPYSKLQRMHNTKRGGSHNVPFIPNHINMDISII